MFRKNRSVSETSEEMDTKKKKAGGSRSSEGAEVCFLRIGDHL